MRRPADPTRRRSAPPPACWARSTLAIALASALSALAQTPPPTTLPGGAQVRSGSATIEQGGAVLTVQQHSARLLTDWQRFDIGSAATVRFVQPGADSMALNRVAGTAPSAIFGRLQANGQVFLLNPAGVIFGASAQVDVGGLVASSLALDEGTFGSGRIRLVGGPGDGAVRQAGRITAAAGGTVALIAPQVHQHGLIEAPGGDVVLAAGRVAEIDLLGNRLLSVRLEAGALDAQVDQLGRIDAAGGRVLLSARAADATQRAVVNQGGVVDASSLVARGGRIVLEADEVRLAAGSRTEARGATGGGQVLAGGGWAGSGPWHAASRTTMAEGALIDASATGSGDGGEVVLWSRLDGGHTSAAGTLLARGAGGGSGGRIETSGHTLDVSGRVDAGPGGQWLLDPVNITITTNGGTVPSSGGTYTTAGNVQAGSIATALAGGNSVTLDTSAGGASQGDITLTADVVPGAMAADATLTLKANRNIIFNAGADIDATTGGNTRRLNLVLWADQDGSGGGEIRLGASGATSTRIATNGGGLWMGGGAGSTSWTPFDGGSALTVGNGSAIGTDATGTGWGLATYVASIDTAGGHLFGRGRSEKNASGSDVALGISLQGSSLSTGAGSLTLTGDVANTSGTAVDIMHGITAHSGTTLDSTSGAITLTGTLDASSRGLRGAGVWLGTKLGATAATGDVSITSTTGAIQITGSGSDAAGAGFRHGLMLRNQFAGDDILIRSTSGAITLDGQAAYRAAIDSTTGLQFQNDTASSTIQVVSQTGAITLRGSNTQDALVNENDLRFVLGNTAGSVRIGYDGSTNYSGDILLEADALYQEPQAGSGALSLQTRGALTIRPGGSAFTQLRAGASGTISFDDDWDFGSLASALTLGKAGNTTALTLSNPITTAGSLQVWAGDITLAANLTTAGTTRLTAGGDIVQNAGVAVNTQGGSAVYHADSDGSGAGMVYLKAGASLATHGGHVWFGGGSGSSSWNGLSVGNGQASGGTVIPKAELQATASDDFKNGITLAGASLDSGGGDIALHGRSGSGNDVFGYVGLFLGGNASIASGAGHITIDAQAAGGTSSGATGWHFGTLLLSTAADGSTQGTASIGATSGSIALTATAQHDQAANQSAGLALLAPAVGGTARIGSTSGAITLSGSNLNASNPSDGGILLSGSGAAQIVSQSGALQLNGTSSNAAVAGLNLAAGRIGGDGVTPFTGTITLNTDALTLGAATRLSSTGTLTVAPANAATSVALGSGASGTLALPATAFSDNFSAGFGGIVVGRSDGSGTMTLGSFTVADPLSLRNGNGGVALDGAVAAAQGLTITTSAGLTGSGTLALGAGQALTLTQAGNSSFAGVVSGTGATLDKAGSGRLTLNADQTFTGTTTISAGTLQFGSGGTAGRVAGNVVVDGALVLDRSDDWTLGGTLSGSGTLTKQGSGTVTLGGSNSHAGGTDIVAGRLSGGAASGTRSAFGSGPVTVRSGATLWLDGATLDNALVLDGGTLLGSNASGEVLRGGITLSADSAIDSTYGITLSGAIGGTGRLTLANSTRDEGVLTLTGAATHGGGTVLSAGVLNLGGGGSTGSLAGGITTTSRSGVVFERSDAVSHGGAITGAGWVEQRGSGTLTLGNAAGHTGATTIASGSTLVWASDAPSLATSGIDGAGTLVIRPVGSSFSGALDLGTLPPLAATLSGLQVGSASNAAALTVSGSVSIAGDITLQAGELTLAGGASLASSTGSIALSASRFVNAAGAAVFSPGGGGHWRVWSRNAAPFDATTGDVRGGLSAHFKQYAATFGSTAVQGSGNGLLYTLAPTLTPTLSGVSKVYDGNASVSVDAPRFGVSGAVDGDDVSLATPTSASFTGAGAANAGTGKAVQAGGVTLLGASAGTATVYGYALASTTASGSDGVITPATLTLSGSRVYDGSTIMPGSALTATGVNGETFAVGGSGASGNLALRDVQNAQALSSVAGLALGSSGNGGLASNYQALSTAGSSVSVTPKALTVSGLTAQDKVYDGTTAATIGASGLLLGGLVSGDDVTLAASGSFADKSVGAGKTVTLSNTLGGADLGNYTVTDQTSATAAISPKTLTLSGITAADKVYDGSTSAVVGTGGLVLGGLVSGDDLAVSSSGAFTDKAVGNAKTVTLTNTFSGADLGNYAIADQASTSASITPRTLTITGIAAVDKVYDGSTAASVDLAGLTLSGLVAGDVVTVASSGQFADKRVGMAKAVTLSNIVGGADAGNYSLTDQASATASILLRDLVVSGIVAADKVYDGGIGAGVSTSGMVLAGLVAGDTVTVMSSGSFADKQVGSARTVALVNTFGGSDLGNYRVSNQATAQAAITPRPLSVAGLQVADKVYDGSVAATVDAGGLSLSGLVAGDVVTVASSASFADRHVGTSKPVTLNHIVGGADRDNYSITAPATTTASITPRALTVGGIVAADKVYDGTTAATLSFGGLTLAGLVTGDDVTVIGSAAFATRNAGNAKAVTLDLTLGGFDLGNYAVVAPAMVTASIAPRPLALGGLTALDKVYDGSSAATIVLSGRTLDGLVAGDDVQAVSTGAFIDRHVGSAKAVSLSHTFGGTDLGNYVITGQASAQADITPRNLSATGIVAANKVYDGSTAATLDLGGLAWSGLVAGDSVTLDSSGRFADRQAGTGKAVLLTHAFGGPDAGNYRFSGPASILADITPRPLMLGGLVALDKVYDGSTAAAVEAAGLHWSGLIAGDEVTVTSHAQFADRHAGTGKRVDFGSVLGGADRANYLLVDQPAGTATITPRPLVVSGIVAQDKVYDGGVAATVDATGLVLSGLVAGDDITVHGTGSFADRHVGQAKPVTLTLAFGGADAGNYRITAPTSGSAAIVQRPSVDWTGAVGGDWMDPTQWAGGALPDGANVAQVVLPAGAVVRLGGGEARLDTLAGAGATLVQSGGLLSAGSAVLGQLQQSGGQFIVAGNAVLGTPLGHLVLGDLQVGDNLTLAVPGGQVTTAPGQQITVGGRVDVTAGQAELRADGALTLGTLNVTGALEVQAGDRLDLGRGGIGGHLDGTAGLQGGTGGIVQSGPLAVAGGVTLDAGAGAIVLTDPGNFLAGPTLFIGLGGTTVDGLHLRTLRQASETHMPMPAPTRTSPAIAPMLWLVDVPADEAPPLGRVPLALVPGDEPEWLLEWTGRVLRLRPRGVDGAARPAAGRQELAAAALREARRHWSLMPERIEAIQILP